MNIKKNNLNISDNTYQIQKRISVVFSISGISVTIANILLSFFVGGLDLYEILSNISVYLTLALTIPFFIFTYIPRNSITVQLLQVLVLFAACVISVWDQYNGIYGMAFGILTLSLMYKYGMLQSRFILKTLVIYVSLTLIIAGSAYNEGRVIAGLQVVMFMTFFLFISYLVFKSEMDKIISTEKRMKNEILNLVIDRDILREKIDENKKQFEELEKQYLDFKKEKKPFDFQKCNLTPSEINVVRVLVKNRATNKEISEELNIKESTVKQHLYRIFNKIGIDNRIQLIDLCEYNF